MLVLAVCDAHHTFSEYINVVDKMRIMYHRMGIEKLMQIELSIIIVSKRWTMEGGCYDYLPLSILLLNIKWGL